jgi:protein disulfide-isomerase A1
VNPVKCTAHHADGEFRASAIAEFVLANKLPLITTLTQENAPAIFDSPIKKQVCQVVCHGILFFAFSHFVGPCVIPLLTAVFYFSIQILLFAVASEASKFLPIFKEAAKPFKGKVNFLLIGPVFDELLTFSCYMYYAQVLHPTHCLFSL